MSYAPTSTEPDSRAVQDCLSRDNGPLMNNGDLRGYIENAPLLVYFESRMNILCLIGRSCVSSFREVRTSELPASIWRAPCCDLPVTLQSVEILFDMLT